MNVFNLPDLGEGLPDAEIVKWLVAEGDTVAVGDDMVEMSTAKAVVEVPCPVAGTIIKLHGGPGDVIETGAPLITFGAEGEEVAAAVPEPAPKPEKETPPATNGAKAPSVPEKPKGAASPAMSQEGVEVFHLPDLGEGLPDAEIVKWLVGVGDVIAVGDPMAELSTDKAVVEMPAPTAGEIVKLHGGPGDVILTGAPLIDIRTGKAVAKSVEAEPVLETEAVAEDSAGIVGEIPVGREVKSETSTSADGIKASPAVRATARKMKIDLAGLAGTGADGEITLKDVRRAEGGVTTAKPVMASETSDVKIGPAARGLADELGIAVSAISPTGPKDCITKQDVINAARAMIAGGGGGSAPAEAPAGISLSSGKVVKAAPKVRAYASGKGVDIARVAASGPEGSVTLADVNAALEADFRAGPSATPTGPYQRPARAYEVTGQAEKLIGPRRVMAQMMAKANAEICHTPIFDEADIAAWAPGTDITVRVMRAVIAAALTEPAINAWYDHGDGTSPSKTIHRHVSLGMAVDSPRGLFVPVLKNLDAMSPAEMRAELDRHRKAINDASITPKDMSGATITLSNYGMMAGKFAAPIISAPEVAIVGIGGLYDKLVMTDGVIANHRFMPVSLTFDHRAATGGEAARFLKGLIDDLQLA